MQFFGARYETVWWCVFGISFLATILAETFRPFRNLSSSTSRRWISNGLLLGTSSVLIRCVYGISGIALAVTVHGSRYGVLNRVALPLALRFVIGFVSLDLAQYLVHRAFHASGFLWRVHQVHHSESDLDATTGLRFHPGEALVTQAALLVLIALLGVPAIAVLCVPLAVSLQDFFTHANISVPAQLDRWLRWLIVTPGMHRTHHSDVMDEQNTNFGTIFSAWDRCFGTYRSGAATGVEVRCGLSELKNGSELNAARLLVLPFRSTGATPAPRDTPHHVASAQPF